MFCQMGISDVIRVRILGNKTTLTSLHMINQIHSFVFDL